MKKATVANLAASMLLGLGLFGGGVLALGVLGLPQSASAQAPAAAVAPAPGAATPPAAPVPAPLPLDTVSLEKMIAAHDPEAVAAARHYYTAPARRAGVLQLFDVTQRRLVAELAQRNQGFDKNKVLKTFEIATDSVKDRIDILLDLSIVIALEKLSTAEIVALDKFYSSPEGMAIVAKMPEVSTDMQKELKAVMPGYVDEVKGRLKATYPELVL